MSRPVRYLLGALVAAILLAGAFSGGLIAGWTILARSPTAGLPFSSQPLLPIPSPATSQSALFQPFWQAWEIVNSEFVDQPLDPQKLMRGAIRGMLEAVEDPYTTYMEPLTYSQATAHLQNEYEGIGAWVDGSSGEMKIIAPMPNSPAEKAGLQAGDTILKVDGKDMTGLDSAVVLSYILGPANTTVVLTIRRENAVEPIEISIVRAKISISSVESKMLANDIAYLKISTFGEKTSAELKTALTALMAQHPKGLILDLRNNGGGYLTTGIDVISQFVPQGVVMYETFGDGSRKSYSTSPGGLATEVPLVVLINKNSASASEITAGAIQDLQRGKLIGETSYGKGEVQKWYPLDDNQGAVRVTVARWLTPNERQIQGVGLTPDLAVALTDEDTRAKRDPQLERALELLASGK